jgi:DNA-binding NtrC family response regulator
MSARILVIDDEEAIRFTFERFLRAAGHLVTTAGSCREALEQINTTTFDIVFADIILEDGTGIEILRHIKAKGLSCPVIMITGDSGVEKAFLKYPWRGNVRELEHTMEHAFVLCNREIITFDNLPGEFVAAPQAVRNSAVESAEAEIQRILEALGNTAWNKAKAARLLGPGYWA